MLRFILGVLLGFIGFEVVCYIIDKAFTILYGKIIGRLVIHFRKYVTKDEINDIIESTGNSVYEYTKCMTEFHPIIQWIVLTPCVAITTPFLGAEQCILVYKFLKELKDNDK